MPYTISESENGHYLIVKLEGKITVPFAIEYTAEAHRVSNEKGIESMLVDVTEAENIESAVDNFGFVYDDMPKLKVNRRVTVVMLASRDDHSHDFIETASRNAGYNVTICRDMKSALALVDVPKKELIK